MAKRRRLWWWLLPALLLLGGAVCWVISGLETKMADSYEVITDPELLTEEAIPLQQKENWEADPEGAFYVEYRLQRDRVRSQEVEMLQEIIDHPNASAESKEEAEAMMLEIIQLMEKELMIENMLKAQGYEDALFFYRNRLATVMVKKKELSEREFLQVTEVVAGALDIEREEVKVIARP
ncbi:MAG: SpoIIIAH-like family protein [Dethiobacteria bacterium]|jgi:stage III sporulation protein AH|nr:SpoIIIAH-like family protein [Bacillota bacterium]HOP68941.1 SpoIIIAH-like family protein [Bacillota bacterium]HPT33911.1 SpoIIIAH-like family protein [Bacillota bacterium]HPZ64302.1 SpoIIIAH-like family protein [Bacillota bacterium]HQD06143.1 SpoIIIAH-like family protein [Bacillota bacterium]